VDTAGTLVRAAETLVRRGVREVYACCTHPVLSGAAVERLANSPIRELVVTDTIPLPPHKRLDRIRVVSVARLLADAVARVHAHSSVSELAEERLAAELVES
jgi:ribose-phosphate pyrophosphokinase